MGVVVERPAAVGQALHAVGVAVLAGQEAARLPEQMGAAQKAWRKSTPWSASRLDVRRGHRVAVGLDVPPGVVGVEIDDVGALLVSHGLSRYSTYSVGNHGYYRKHSAPGRAGEANGFLSHLRYPAQRQHTPLRGLVQDRDRRPPRRILRGAAPFRSPAQADRVLRGCRYGRVRRHARGWQRHGWRGAPARRRRGTPRRLGTTSSGSSTAQRLRTGCSPPSSCGATCRTSSASFVSSGAREALETPSCSRRSSPRRVSSGSPARTRSARRSPCGRRCRPRPGAPTRSTTLAPGPTGLQLRGHRAPAPPARRAGCSLVPVVLRARHPAPDRGLRAACGRLPRHARRDAGLRRRAARNQADLSRSPAGAPGRQPLGGMGAAATLELEQSTELPARDRPYDVPPFDTGEFAIGA